MQLCYDWRWGGQSVLMWSTHLGLTTRFLLLSDSCRFVDMGHLSDKRMGLPLTIAADLHQRSHSWFRVPWDSWPYFTVSDSRLSQPGGPGPRIYVPRNRVAQLYPQALGYSSQVKVTLRLTVSQSVSLVLSPLRGSWPNIYYCLTITVLFLWGALSDERTRLPFVYAAGPRHRSLSWFRVPWDFWSYFTVSDFRLPFCSLLQHTVERWRYLTPPPHGSLGYSKSKLHWDWR
jgi:hypothetical protein